MARTKQTARKARAESKSTTTQTEQAAQVERLRPVSIIFSPGNLVWDDKDIPGNVAGISSIAYAAVVMLETVVNDKASETDVAEIKKMLDYIGGSEAMKEFRDKVHQRISMSVPGTNALSNLFNEGRWKPNPRNDLQMRGEEQEAVEEGGEQLQEVQEVVTEEQGRPTKRPYFK
ncbi:hypothetical protein H0G86_001006 [Trichoderma simmonsii]|uniref:Uncharacterized protein n=1 Tax=Trichoderma simmonsii TaxID=1491479 RepID=A0A8G0L0R6_9HYPO|nr:hypothetical protein H0G86_001006 [Trichoderma simmonsii]